MSSTPLIYREGPAAAQGRGTLLLLHGLGGDIGQLAPLTDALRLPLRPVYGQAWRACNPRQYAASERLGFLWYFDHGPGRPEAATFGDALWAVEQFIQELAEDPGRRPLFMLGFGQGAVLASTLAGVAPDLLAGVAAIGGHIPDIPGWSPPFREMAGLPVLLLNDPAEATAIRRRTVWTRDAFKRLGADMQFGDGVYDQPLAAVEALRAWFDDQLAVQDAD